MQSSITRWGGLVPAMLVVLLVSADASAQWRRSPRPEVPASDELNPPPRRMIDAPTAGTLSKGSFDTELRAFPDGGVLGILQFGLTNRWQIGFSYGGTDVISSNDPTWNPRMQFLTKLQILGENMVWPGISVGYEEQGFGLWIDSLNRYQIKSKGFYAVASKGYRTSGFTSSIHGGINYSREDKHDKDVNFFFGGDVRFDNSLGMVAEYDMALNDDRTPHSLGKGRGYLNFGVRWLILNQVYVEGVMKDLLENRRDTDSFGRELRLIYVERL
ncbi:MAG: hypothetical protein AB1752_00175 [Candidatus Zixiibacteriota bacterium]